MASRNLQDSLFVFVFFSYVHLFSTIMPNGASQKGKLNRSLMHWDKNPRAKGSFHTRPFLIFLFPTPEGLTLCLWYHGHENSLFKKNYNIFIQYIRMVQPSHSHHSSFPLSQCRNPFETMAWFILF